MKDLPLPTGDDPRHVLIRDLSVSPKPDEEYLAVLLENNLVYRIKMEKA